MSELNVIRLGLGSVVCNYGTYEGKPALFLEPVLGEPGLTGEKVPDGREPQIVPDAIATGTIIQMNSVEGARVLLEDLQVCMASFVMDAAPPETGGPQ
jgi:hypothetical protein